MQLFSFSSRMSGSIWAATLLLVVALTLLQLFVTGSKYWRTRFFRPLHASHPHGSTVRWLCSRTSSYGPLDRLCGRSSGILDHSLCFNVERPSPPPAALDNNRRVNWDEYVQETVMPRCLRISQVPRFL